MTFQKTLALSLPEIVLAIGKSIPLWVPEDKRGRTVWCLKPRDLVSAISVNRLFHTLLTPILWFVFAFPVDHSHEIIYEFDYDDRSWPFNIFAKEIIERNSVHFRYLDLSFGSHPDNSFQVETLQLCCTRLRELRLSSTADLACVGRLIEANLGLHKIYWDRSIYRGKSTHELTPLFPLRQLRTLSLNGWPLNSVHIHHILSNNANSLEEVILGGRNGGTFLLSKPPMSLHWDGLETSPQGLEATEEEKTEAAQLIQGRRLLCPKVKSLELQTSWSYVSPSALTFLCAFPALENLTLGFVDQYTGLLLAQAIKESCPNVRSLRHSILQYNGPYIPHDKSDGLVSIIEACTPGNLDHVAIALRTFEDTFKQALLKHGDRLEVLEIALQYHDTPGVLENICKVLQRCKRLKKFSMYNYHRSYEVQDVSILLEGLKECHELENLSLIGFPFIDRNEDFIPQVEYERTDQFFEDMKYEITVSEDVLPTGWKYCERAVFGLNQSVSTEKLRRLAFEAVEGLPLLTTLILNMDWFEKDLK